MASEQPSPQRIKPYFLIELVFLQKQSLHAKWLTFIVYKWSDTEIYHLCLLLLHKAN